MDKYFKIQVCRAKEEIVHFNVEIQRRREGVIAETEP